MRYQYLFSREQMQTMTDQTRQSYEKNRKNNTPFFAFVLNTLYERIKSDPIRYRAFGMYWWAVKAIFIEHGLDFGIANLDKTPITKSKSCTVVQSMSKRWLSQIAFGGICISRISKAIMSTT